MVRKNVYENSDRHVYVNIQAHSMFYIQNLCIDLFMDVKCAMFKGLG